MNMMLIIKGDEVEQKVRLAFKIHDKDSSGNLTLKANGAEPSEVEAMMRTVLAGVTDVCL